MSELAIIETGQLLTAVQVKAQVQLIQEVMAATMKNGTHYGTIPGCGDKPALLKPGAEKICSTFRMAPDPIIENLSDYDLASYQVTCRMLSQTTGMFLGAGIGSASSDEEKYKWKKAVCDEEWDETPEDRRREKWCKGFGNKPNYQVKQIRTNPADNANTVLKMAKKRALIDAVLTITAASDVFVQDLEESLGGEDGLGNPIPAAQQPTEKAITTPQLKRLFAIAKSKGLNEELIKANLKAKMNYDGHLSDLPRSVYDTLVTGIEKMPDKAADVIEQAQEAFDGEIVSEEINLEEEVPF